jgi:hypothetical protein
VRGEVLDVQERERHARPSQLDVKGRAVGLGPLRGLRCLRIEERLERLVVERLHAVRVQPVRGRHRHHPGHGARADPERSRHLAVRAPERQFLSQNLSQSKHRKSRCRHAAL